MGGRVLAVGLTAAVTLWGAAPAWAQTTPAPPAEASAVAAQVDEVVAVANTETRADAGSGTATANALEVGGNAPIAQAGVTQQGDGEQSQTVLPVDVPGVVSLKVLPSNASVRTTDNGATRTSTARAALLRLVLLDGVVAVDVLQSFAEAIYTSQRSEGRGSTDTVNANLAGIRLVLLHSEASTSAGGSSYVVGVNDTRLITNNDVGNTVRVVDVPGILRLNAVTVNGGPGSELVKASAVDAAVVSIPALLNSTTAKGAASAPAAAAPAELGEASGGGGGGLPRTGTAVGGLILLGMALVAAGGLVARLTRSPVAA